MKFLKVFWAGTLYYFNLFIVYETMNIFHTIFKTVNHISVISFKKS